MTTDTKIVTVATNPRDVFHSGQLTTLKNSETLKGSASGEIIGIDNISPVEHIMDVKVRSRNMFDPSKLLNASGWTVTDGVYSGKSRPLYDLYVYKSDGTGTPILTGFEVGKRYAIKYFGRADLGEGDGGGITFRFVYDDGTTSGTSEAMITSTTETEISHWSTSGKNVVGLHVHYWNNVQNYIRDIQVTEVTTAIPPFTPHIPDLSTATKNLFKTTNYSKGSIDIATGSVSSAVHVRTYIETSDYIPLKAGTYTVSYKTGANLRYVCLYNKNKETIGNFWSNRKNPYTFTINEDCLVRIDIETAKVDDVQPNIENYDTFFADFEVQLELGNTVTKYIPYVPDLSTVNVKTAGKNLLSEDIFAPKNWRLVSNGVRYVYKLPTINGDCVFSYALNGTRIPGYHTIYRVPKGMDYEQADAEGVTTNMGFLTHETNTTVVTTSKVLPKGYDYYYWICYASVIDKDLASFEYMQLEVGTDATEYEAYKGQDTYTPIADGTVEGVVNIYPNMTLLTDTNGAIIDCNYYKDIDKTFDELLTNVALSGGEG